MRRMLCGMAVVLTVAGGGARLDAQPAVTVYVTGLNDPRGMAFGPDKRLYVAEAGSGGATLSTVGQCPQVVAIGPFTGGFSARIVRIRKTGDVTITIADGLPSAEANPAVGGDKMGVSALAFVGRRLFSLIAGAGCSHGHADDDNGVFEVGSDGIVPLANLSAWLRANPGSKPSTDPDYEPDGTWYSMVYQKSRLYALEPNHGLLVRVDPRRGTVRLVADLFARLGDHTPTSMAFDDKDLWVSTLGRFDFLPGTDPPVPDMEHSFEAGVYRLSTSGRLRKYYGGLHAVIAVAVDSRHRVYALQSPILDRNAGSLVRLNAAGGWDPILTGLDTPSAMTFGPGGDLFVTECGFHCGQGEGRIIRVRVP